MYNNEQQLNIKQRTLHFNLKQCGFVHYGGFIMCALEFFFNARRSDDCVMHETSEAR